MYNVTLYENTASLKKKKKRILISLNVLPLPGTLQDFTTLLILAF